MKNQKGVTLMILVVTVIVMILIVGTISYNSLTGYQLNDYYTMCSDIELLDEKIALYYLEKKELPIKDETVTIPEATQGGNVNYNPNNSQSEPLYKIDLDKLDNLTLKWNDYYIDKQSHTIYSSSGKKVGNEIYYTVPVNYEKVSLSLYR